MAKPLALRRQLTLKNSSAATEVAEMASKIERRISEVGASCPPTVEHRSQRPLSVQGPNQAK